MNQTPSKEQSGQSLVSGSELRAIFTDYDQPTAPYEGRALRLTLTADLAFIAIGKLVEGVGTESFTHNEDDTIGVDAQQLYETLGAMLRRTDRYTAERAAEGSLPVNHPLLTAVALPVQTLAIRRRA